LKLGIEFLFPRKTDRTLDAMKCITDLAKISFVYDLSSPREFKVDKLVRKRKKKGKTRIMLIED